MSKKRGKLHNDELNFIRRNVMEMSDMEIANQLNRSVELVQKIIAEEKLRPIESQDEIAQKNRLRQELHKKKYWAIVKKQFLPDELQYFEDEWIRAQIQFKEDVRPTEELQLKQYLTTVILKDRIVIGQRSNLEYIEQMQKQLEDEYQKDSTIRDTELMASLATQIAGAKAADASYTSAYDKYSNDINRQQKALRASRDDRIKRIEDSKTSWQGLLRLLEDEEKRRELGEEAELFKIAAQERAKKLAEWHEYEDGKVDQPLLDVEYLKDDREEREIPEISG